MKIGIITPMPEEKKALTAAIQNGVEKKFADLTVLVGDYAGHQVFLAESGIGKVAAATAATMLTQVFNVEVLINTGSAGALQPDLAIGDAVIGTELTYFDADVRIFGYDFGQLPDQPARFKSDQGLVDAFTKLTNAKPGLIVSGDSFVQDAKKAEIAKFFPEAQVAEMEGAAVAQVANRFHVPFIVLRGVSDLANGESSVTFDEYVVEAGRQSAKLLLTYLDSIAL
ncbi:5'-methylthioadenosine/adenosylhomocysteine nucleosidase [Fructobacillus ficulneus]|uniref:adenosylhomocysteine nucleosidase n=1 Tax=Fructobacillus ficulneus TaxID=157463 RepID=A0A0K8MIY4_9LACO|nr:5'-methylthioadenosine/adenosylhomocysteine nucleosidase [Fructobacillus ficulneus]GAP00517.1 MTA/SAH nucleosidase [Fructobacillus ficulneus]